MRTKLMLILGGCVIASAGLVSCDTAPTMRVASPTVAVGEDVVVSFDTPIRGKAANLYWIALLSVDAPESRSAGRMVVEHGQTNVRLRATESGTFEVRLHDRYPQEESHLVARAPVRVVAQAAEADIPPAAAHPRSEWECLDGWLAMQKLDAYGSPEGSVYANTSPLYDKAADRMTLRTSYLYAKLPEAKIACALAPARSPE